MIHQTQCKFCHKPIGVEVDDDYAGLGDPFKLLPLASCNRCSDLRVERRNLELRLERCCSLVSMTGLDEAKRRETLKGVLGTLSRKYAEMISRWHNHEGSLWDESIVSQLMDNPAHWGNTISHMWRSFGQWKHRQVQQPALPYKDA